MSSGDQVYVQKSLHLASWQLKASTCNWAADIHIVAVWWMGERQAFDKGEVLLLNSWESIDRSQLAWSPYQFRGLPIHSWAGRSNPVAVELALAVATGNRNHCKTNETIFQIAEISRHWKNAGKKKDESALKGRLVHDTRWGLYERGVIYSELWLQLT